LYLRIVVEGPYVRRSSQGGPPWHEGAHAQETLDSYGVQHDQFDFESELGWEGSNDKFLTIMKDSPYFVPQTQSNDQGVPQARCPSPHPHYPISIILP
jgi:hypothetical protein